MHHKLFAFMQFAEAYSQYIKSFRKRVKSVKAFGHAKKH